MELFLPVKESGAGGRGLESFVEFRGKVTELESAGNEGVVWWAGAPLDKV